MRTAYRLAWAASMFALCALGCRRSAGPGRSSLRASGVQPPGVPPTLAEDLAATPDWASGRTAYDTPYVEQIEDAEKTFTDAAPTSLDAGVSAALACRVEASRTRNWDMGFTVAPDLSVWLRVGDGPEVYTYHEDHYVAYVTHPASRLAPGVRVALRVLDADLDGSEPVGDGAAVLGATTPWTIQRGLLTVECRALTEPAMAPRLTAAWRTVDEHLTWLEDAASVPADSPPLWRDFAVRVALRHAAGLVGWADPRVRARVTRRASVVARHPAWFATPDASAAR